jgi:hypothetical protein
LLLFDTSYQSTHFHITSYWVNQRFSMYPSLSSTRLFIWIFDRRVIKLFSSRILNHIIVYFIIVILSTIPNMKRCNCKSDISQYTLTADSNCKTRRASVADCTYSGINYYYFAPYTLKGIQPIQ